MWRFSDRIGGMNWTCADEHKPVKIGEGVYCAKCGTMLSEERREMETHTLTPFLEAPSSYLATIYREDLILKENSQ